MATDPAQRYRTPRALADDVEHWLADEPVSALRDRLFTGAWRWVRHHRTFATSAAAVALVTLTAFGIALRREQSHGTRLATAYHEVNEANTRLTQANAELARSNAEADRWLNRAMGSIEDYFTGVSEEALLGGKLPPALLERLLARPLAFYEQLTRELASQHDPSDTDASCSSKDDRTWDEFSWNWAGPTKLGGSKNADFRGGVTCLFPTQFSTADKPVFPGFFRL